MQQKNRRNFFELFTEIMGWLQIVVSPLLLGVVIGFIIYLKDPWSYGLALGIAAVTLGLVTGIIFATRVWKKQGTMHFLSRVSASPELDGKHEETKPENKTDEK
ncbi:MAG: hypothetical protein WBP16_16955 [Ferruginibacter sp.]